MPGQDIQALNHATALTTAPLLTPPSDFVTAPVLSDHLTLQTGIIGGVPQGPFNPDKYYLFDAQGGTITVETGGHKSFTNQECGVNECAPAAVSNSLKTIGVGTDAQNSIGTVKPLVGWTAGGVPANWPTTKAAGTSGAPYNLTTTASDPKAMTAAQRIALFMTIMQALRDGKDVEVDNPWHVGMVTRATKTTIGGKVIYTLWVAHDTKQGAAGGTIEEPLQYDPATNMFSGGTAGFFKDSIMDQITIEAKK